MPEFLAALLSCLLVGIGLEGLLVPRPQAIWRRCLAAQAVTLGLLLLAFCLELLLFRRPWFAATAVAGFCLLLVLISNTKYQALREPFFFQDFEYFSDALRHPRLYIPFFGIGKSLIAAALFIGLVVFGLWVEAPLTYHPDALILVWLWLALLLVAAGGLLYFLPRLMPPSFDPALDLQQQGLLASLCAYWLAERRVFNIEAPAWWQARLPADEKAHVLVVQSESFVDLRAWHADIRPEVLDAFDLCRQEALQHGRLQVPAWGANTVRSEYAFLSGIDPARLGVHRFNPYRKFARQSPYTLAAWYRQQGYRTLCVHPYPASFYRRDQTYPLMGFDEFIDISGFPKLDEGMPYVSDQRVTDRVCELLQDGGPPLFVFVITMENHGPLHLEQPAAEDAPRLYCSALAPEQGDELTIYLRHQHNANRMIVRLRDHLQVLHTPALFCWYGDHVPIMPQLYARLGEPDGNTDYFIWSSRRQSRAPATLSAAHELAEALIRQQLSA